MKNIMANYRAVLIVGAVFIMSSFSLNKGTNENQTQFFYWILYNSNQAWFTTARSAPNFNASEAEFSQYCQRKNLIAGYNRRVQGPFANVQICSNSRADAMRQWKNSNFQVIDWYPAP